MLDPELDQVMRYRPLRRDVEVRIALRGAVATCGTSSQVSSMSLPEHPRPSSLITAHTRLLQPAHCL